MLKHLHTSLDSLTIDLDQLIEDFWEECMFLQVLQCKGVPWKRRKEIPEEDVQKVNDIGLQVTDHTDHTLKQSVSV
mgnify:CR=1 FL=1